MILPFFVQLVNQLRFVLVLIHTLFQLCVAATISKLLFMTMQHLL